MVFIAGAWDPFPRLMCRDFILQEDLEVFFVGSDEAVDEEAVADAFKFLDKVGRGGDRRLVAHGAGGWRVWKAVRSRGMEQ
jgi:hypothetical protein